MLAVSLSTSLKAIFLISSLDKFEISFGNTFSISAFSASVTSDFLYKSLATVSTTWVLSVSDGWAFELLLAFVSSTAGVSSVAALFVSSAAGASSVSTLFVSSAFGAFSVAALLVSSAFGASSVSTLSVSSVFGASSVAVFSVSSAFGASSVAALLVSSAAGASSVVALSVSSVFGASSVALSVSSAFGASSVVALSVSSVFGASSVALSVSSAAGASSVSILSVPSAFGASSVVACSVVSAFSSVDACSVVFAFSSVDACSVVSLVTSTCSGISDSFEFAEDCSIVWTLPFTLLASELSSCFWVVLFSAASAWSFATPKIKVAPTKIEAVPTVKRLIEYLLSLFGRKSSFFFEFLFIQLTTPKN